MNELSIYSGIVGVNFTVTYKLIRDVIQHYEFVIASETIKDVPNESIIDLAEFSLIEHRFTQRNLLSYTPQQLEELKEKYLHCLAEIRKENRPWMNV